MLSYSSFNITFIPWYYETQLNIYSMEIDVHVSFISRNCMYMYHLFHGTRCIIKRKCESDH